MRNHHLHRVFEPDSVAVIGASERDSAVGYRVLRNILEGGYGGAIYPVHPHLAEVQGLPCCPSLRELDHPVDLAVMAVPAAEIPELMHQCGEREVAAVLIISAGFGETGPQGQRLQDEIVDLARTYGIRLLGPNCLGVMRPGIGLNATFTLSKVRPGSVALVAQSASFCTAILDWADSSEFGLSAVASLGATADVGFGEVLDYLATDPQTRSILLYVEGINDARSFLSGLRGAARVKPVIVVKSGQQRREGVATGFSHTDAFAGSDDIFDVAIQRAGAVRVHTVSQLFSAARILASCRPVRGARLAVVTNGAGPGLMAADRALSLGVSLANCSEEAARELRTLLPDHWQPGHTIDLLGNATEEHYGKALQLLLKDRKVDGVLVLLAPQGMSRPTECARAVAEAAAGSGKLVLACWLGEKLVREGRRLLEEAGIPHFTSPESGVEAFAYLAAYHRNQNSLLQVPPPLSAHREPDVEGALLIIRHALAERRHTLTNTEARAVIHAFRIPVTPCINATSATDALIAAETVGLPVAMKINSPDITFKADVGGVRLNVQEPRSVGSAFAEMMAEVASRAPGARIDGITIEPMLDRPHAREIRVAIGQDPVFGPVISVGAGGAAAEVHADLQSALPPLNTFLCRELIGRTRAQRSLESFRNLPEADIPGLIDILMRVSELACEVSEVQDLVINPVLVDENGVVAVDADLVVRKPVSGRYEHMAIHPYPQGLASTHQLASGEEVLVRPIRPEDADIERTFVENLSEESRYNRFISQFRTVSPQMLARFTQIDYDREMALVAVLRDNTPEASMIAVARYISYPDGETCEFALTVGDAYQREGIGSGMMQLLMEVARERGMTIMVGDVLHSNKKMLALCRKLGFRVMRNEDEPDMALVRRHL